MGEFMAANWYWVGPLLLVIGGAIVKATPTKVDDLWWQKAKGVYDSLRKKE